MPVDRRQFLAAGVGAAMLVATRRAWGAQPASEGLYGPLSTQPDANGLLLPDGFESRVVGISGTVVPGTSYEWHTFPDGGATFATSDGGWVYASNSEVPTPDGGVGALRFSKRGEITDAYRILDGTGGNCAGGPTPWKRWLSCEERVGGHVWECNPLKAGQGIERPALGTFSHEAAAVDPVGKAVYLTEDDANSRLYRFLPDDYPDLEAGRLQAAIVDDAGHVTWKDVPADAPDRSPETTVFNRGEGMCFDRGRVIFTTTGDNKVWELNTKTQHLEVIYDATLQPDAPLRGVDNVVVHRRGRDIYVAEDGDNLELCVLAAPSRAASPVLRVEGQSGTELCGPAFSPDGTRLYFSSQRGAPGGQNGPGITFEVRGPFRGAKRA